MFSKQVLADDGTMQNVAVQLVDVYITHEVTTAWSPVTTGSLCIYVNDMLSITGGIEGLFNIFDVDADTMMYDKAAMAADIEKYGLFTYEDFEGIISEEIFEAFNCKYFKVAMGKGMLTWDDIYHLIDRFGEYLY